MRLWLALLACTAALQAEPLRHPEFLKEYAETRGFLLGRPVKPKISRGRVFFLRSEARSRSQSFYEWKDGKAQLLLSPEALLKGQDEKLSPEEKARNERKRQLGTGFTDYFPSPDGSTILLPLAGKLYLLDARGHRQLNIEGSTLDPQWSPDSRKIAYVKAQDVWVYDLAKKKEQAATTGGTLEVTHGIAEFVAQEEMHRLSGYCWSPDSRKIAFEEADHRHVEVWHISDPLHPETRPAHQFYPRPGKANVKARVGIVALENPRRITWVGLPLEYLGALRWDKHGPLTLQLQDRLQQKLRLVEVDPVTGRLATLCEETSPAWVPLHQEVPIWLDGQRFLYLLQRGDRLALAVLDRRKNTRFLDEQQDYDISEIVAYVPEKKAVLCRIDRQPGDPRLHWLAVEGPAPEAPSVNGVQEAVTSDNLTVVNQQSMEHLPRLLLGDQELEGKGAEPRLPGQVEFDTVTVDGVEYRAALIWPEPRPQKAPVIVDVYGGPTKVQVAHNRRNWLMDQWLAQQGFVVVAVDNRGTPGRGRAWETAVYGKFGSLPLDDQVRAVTALAAKHPELDLEHVGVWGWSFGGYLSAQAVLKRPDFFKAAIAGAPVTDWEDYDTHYTERYLGTPQSQPEAYRGSSLLPLAGRLTRPLLLVHGSADDNVYYRHSLKLSEALFRAGQPHELLTLPGITHSFRADVGITERLWARTVAFFKQHLGEPLTTR